LLGVIAHELTGIFKTCEVLDPCLWLTSFKNTIVVILIAEVQFSTVASSEGFSN